MPTYRVHSRYLTTDIMLFKEGTQVKVVSPDNGVEQYSDSERWESHITWYSIVKLYVLNFSVTSLVIKYAALRSAVHKTHLNKNMTLISPLGPEEIMLSSVMCANTLYRDHL